MQRVRREILLAVGKSWNEDTCLHNVIKFIIFPKIVVEAIHMPNKGIEFKREAKERKLEARENFAKSFKNQFKLKKLQSCVSHEYLLNH